MFGYYSCNKYYIFIIDHQLLVPTEDKEFYIVHRKLFVEFNNKYCNQLLISDQQSPVEGSELKVL